MNSKSRLLIGLAAIGLFGGMSSPAHAVLQIAADIDGVLFSCVDNAACDTNPAVGILQTANGTFNGVEVNSSIQTSTGTPANPGVNALDSSSLSIINTTGVAKTVTFAIGDTDFLGPVSAFTTAGAGTWQVADGSSATLNWYDDPLNGQGADTATDTPGNLIDTFSTTAVGLTDSFHHDGSGLVADSGPFSMTEQGTFTLTPFGQLVNTGTAEDKSAAPEPATWAMMLIGFAGLSLAGYWQNRAARRSSRSQVRILTFAAPASTRQRLQGP
jgi:hypothetical protein